MKIWPAEQSFWTKHRFSRAFFIFFQGPSQFSGYFRDLLKVSTISEGFQVFQGFQGSLATLFVLFSLLTINRFHTFFCFYHYFEHINVLVLVFLLWLELSRSNSFPAKIYLFKVNNRNTRKRYEICSKLTIETPEQCHCLSPWIPNPGLPGSTWLSGKGPLSLSSFRGQLNEYQEISGT